MIRSKGREANELLLFLRKDSFSAYSFVVLPELVSLNFEVEDGPVMGCNLSCCWLGRRTSHDVCWFLVLL